MKILNSLVGGNIGLIAYLSLLLSITLFFASIFFGLDFTDSFYHLNQALYPVGDKHLYPFLGSSLILKKIITLVGPEILHLRFVNSLLLFISFLFPFLLLKLKLTTNKNLFYLACGLFLFLPFNVNILGYDTLSIFFLSLIFTISIRYVKNPTFSKFIFLSILSSVAVLVRLPNLLVLPIISLWFLLFRKDFPKTFLYRWQAGLFLLLSFLGILLCYTLYYGSWNSFKGASANASSHVIAALLKNYLRDGIQLFLFLSFTFITHALFLRTMKIASKISAYILLVIVLLIFMSYYLLPTKYIFNYALFIFAIVLAFIIIHLFYRKKQSLLQLQIFSLYLLFLFINLFGSNTGLLKGYSLFVLFPFVFSAGNPEGKNYWVVLLLILVPFSFINKMYGIYEDNNLLRLKTVPKNELLGPVRTNEVRTQYLNTVDTLVKSMKNQDIKVYFYGDKSHIFHYLYPETILLNNTFYQPINGFLKEYQKALPEKGDVAVFIVNSYPQNLASRVNLLEQDIFRKGFQKVRNGNVKYYLRTSSHQQASGLIQN